MTILSPVMSGWPLGCSVLSLCLLARGSSFLWLVKTFLCFWSSPSDLWLSSCSAMWELGPLILLWSVLGLCVLWLHCRQRKEKFQGVKKHQDSSECQCRDPEMEREGGLRAWRACQGGFLRTWDRSPPQKSPLCKHPGPARDHRVTCHPWVFPSTRDAHLPKGCLVEVPISTVTPSAVWFLASRASPHPQLLPSRAAISILVSTASLSPPRAEPPAPLGETPGTWVHVLFCFQVVPGEAHHPLLVTTWMVSCPPTFPSFLSLPPCPSLPLLSPSPLTLFLPPWSPPTLAPTYPSPPSLQTLGSSSPLPPCFSFPHTSFPISLSSQLSLPWEHFLALSLPGPSLSLPSPSTLPTSLPSKYSRGIPPPQPLALSSLPAEFPPVPVPLPLPDLPQTTSRPDPTIGQAKTTLPCRDEYGNSRGVQACYFPPPATPAHPPALHIIRRATAICTSRLRKGNERSGAALKRTPCGHSSDIKGCEGPLITSQGGPTPRRCPQAEKESPHALGSLVCARAQWDVSAAHEGGPSGDLAVRVPVRGRRRRVQFAQNTESMYYSPAAPPNELRGTPSPAPRRRFCLGSLCCWAARD
ncbi:uncharacterized protein LOC143684185 [Tamandua tetradactyla]|uniref:uncharacterized protein LOC143684185 n=1 Tax=Tamandua tetradactyla TaxID=48850 RepID=UPI00405400AE